MLTYEDALARVGRALQFGINPSLQPVRDACAKLGDPQKRYRIVQVAGTNGKTSVSRMCAAVLTANGLRAGHYVSPHLEEYTERFVIDGAEIEQADFAIVLEEVLPAVVRVEEERDQPLTEFELLTVMAFQYFADAGCDVVVLEVGLGGRWDATSVADPDVAVITTIALDHTDRLGSDEMAIAREKAEIIKPGGRLITGLIPDKVRSVIDGRAVERGVPQRRLGKDIKAEPIESADGTTGVVISTPGGLVDDVWLPVQAPYQRENAAVAVAAAEWILEPRGLDAAATTSALASLSFPGRMEQLEDEPTLILDGAHNASAATALAEALRAALAGRRIVLVMGIMADKNVAGIAEPLVAVADSVVCTKNWSPRCMAPDELAEIVRHVSERWSRPPKPIEAMDSLSRAMERALELAGEDGAVVVTGSLYTAGEARTWWRARD